MQLLRFNVLKKYKAICLNILYSANSTTALKGINNKSNQHKRRGKKPACDALNKTNFLPQLRAQEVQCTNKNSRLYE